MLFASMAIIKKKTLASRGNVKNNNSMGKEIWSSITLKHLLADCMCTYVRVRAGVCVCVYMCMCLYVCV